MKTILWITNAITVYIDFNWILQLQIMDVIMDTTEKMGFLCIALTIVIILWTYYLLFPSQKQLKSTL